MDLFLLLLFLIVGIAGLFFGTEIGVFIGMGLIPWQILKLRLGKKINLFAIILSTIAGVIFFIKMNYWILLLLFLFIELYNYWGYYTVYGEGTTDHN